MKTAIKLSLLSLIAVGALAACAANGGSVSYDIKTGDTYELQVNKDLDYSKVKVGLICLHDTNSTYDKNFIDSMEEARVALGLREDQVLVRTGIGAIKPLLKWSTLAVTSFSPIPLVMKTI